MIVRVLAIPSGQETDAEGRSIGSDWLLADFGESSDGSGTHYYLTTDRIHASEMPELHQLDPDWLAYNVANWINNSWKAHGLRTWTEPPQTKETPHAS